MWLALYSYVSNCSLKKWTLYGSKNDMTVFLIWGMARTFKGPRSQQWWQLTSNSPSHHLQSGDLCEQMRDITGNWCCRQHARVRMQHAWVVRANISHCVTQQQANWAASQGSVLSRTFSFAASLTPWELLILTVYSHLHRHNVRSSQRIMSTDS